VQDDVDMDIDSKDDNNSEVCRWDQDGGEEDGKQEEEGKDQDEVKEDQGEDEEGGEEEHQQKCLVDT
jgi:hypothetical protein